MQGVLIPPVNQITKVVSVADFVLVIEKEASFRQLVSSGFAGMFPNGILVTVCCSYSCAAFIINRQNNKMSVYILIFFPCSLIILSYIYI